MQHWTLRIDSNWMSKIEIKTERRSRFCKDILRQQILFEWNQNWFKQTLDFLKTILNRNYFQLLFIIFEKLYSSRTCLTCKDSSEVRPGLAHFGERFSYSNISHSINQILYTIYHKSYALYTLNYTCILYALYFRLLP